MSCVYGFPEIQNRHLLWEWLEQIGENLSRPLAVIGDFNQVFFPHEKLSGSSKIPGAQDSIDSINRLHLFPLLQKGSDFTWSNNRKGLAKVWERLDKALVNTHWLDKYPFSNIQVWPRATSDHVPISLQLNNDIAQKSRMRWKYEFFWEKFEQTSNIIQEVWRHPISGSPAFRVKSKLQQSLSSLHAWNKQNIGSIPHQINILESHLLHHPVGQNMAEMDLIQHKLDFFYECQDMLLAQRAKLLWLRNGDRNTKFFHNVVRHRKAQNWIGRLKSLQGIWLSDTKSIMREACSFYVNLFATSVQERRFITSEANRILPDISIPVLSVSHKDFLNRPFSLAEIKDAVFQMRSDSAPGLDGFHARFFQKNWEVVQRDIYEMVVAFQTSGFLLKELNKSVIILLSKSDSAHTIRDYRPISLCNVSYKIISKVMANRLKPLLPDLTAPEHSA